MSLDPVRREGSSPVPFAINAAVGWLTNSNLSAQCGVNGVDCRLALKSKRGHPSFADVQPDSLAQQYSSKTDYLN